MNFAARLRRLTAGLIDQVELTDTKVAAILEDAIAYDERAARFRGARGRFESAQQALARASAGVRIGGLLDALDTATEREALSITQSAYDQGLGEVDRTRGVDAFPSDPGFNQFDRETVRILSDNLVAGLHGATETVGRRADDVLRRSALQSAMASYRGDHHADNALGADRYVRQLREQGITSFVDSAGRSWTLKNYATMHIVTVRSEAANLAVATRVLARGFDLVDVNHSDKCCDACQRIDGKTFSLTGATFEYPVLRDLPPLHPRCEHYITISKAAVAARERLREAASA